MVTAAAALIVEVGVSDSGGGFSCSGGSRVSCELSCVAVTTTTTVVVVVMSGVEVAAGEAAVVEAAVVAAAVVVVARRASTPVVAVRAVTLALATSML